MGASSEHRAHRVASLTLRALAMLIAIAVISLVGIKAGIAVTRGADHQVARDVGLSHASLSSGYGPTKGGTKVTISAPGLNGVTAVDFGPKPARFVVNADASITAVAPAGRGTVVVWVTNPTASPSRSAEGRFTYLAAPTVTSVSPSTGPSKGGTTVLVRGAGFAPGAGLLIGAHSALAVRVRNADSLVAVAPAGFGRLALRVITPGGTSHANSSVRFGYRATVLVIGDSIGIDLGWGFTGALPGASLLSVVDDAVGSTGLVRWDFYSWPSHLRADLRAVHPQYVVALFGANDQQRIPVPGGTAAVGTKAWAKAYEARARLLSSIVTTYGAELCWMGLPRMGPNSVVSSSFVNVVNQIDRAAMNGSPRSAFVSTAGLFSTTSGQYTPMVRIPSGAVVVGRQPDGVHLTPDGATAIDVLAVRAMARFGAARAA